MTSDDLLAGIRNANYHCGGIRCLRLFRLPRELARSLRHEVARLCEAEHGSDVSEREHVTNWTRPTGAVQQFSLLNRSGDFADFRDDHDLSCRGKSFFHESRYPQLAAFIVQFQHAINFRVNVLGAGAGLSPHKEHSLFLSEAGTPAVRARFHLAVFTSRLARMTLEDTEHWFAPRTIYYFNQGCVHAASNPGNAPRIHLVWDMLLTLQVFELMFGEAVTPARLIRISPPGRSVRVIGTHPVSNFARIPPLVTPLEADRLALSPVQ